MREVRPIPVKHNRADRAFVFKDLASCTHVFLRNIAKKSLERPYTGPYKILDRITDCVYRIDNNGTPKSVSTELLKPAYDISDNSPTPQTSAPLKTYTRKKVTFASAV